MSAIATPSPIPSTPRTPPPTDPRDLSDPSEIAAQLAALTRREAEVTLALNALISDRAGVDGALQRLQSLTPHVDALSAQVDGVGSSSRSPGRDQAALGYGSPGLGLGQHGFGAQHFDETVLGQENEGLVARVSRVYETSERVGGKVRRLDEEIGRVRQAADVVTEVLELKNSLANLRGYIEKHDWENAARACRRAMDVRPDVLHGGFAATVVPTTESPLPPPQQLSELRSVLLTTFRAEFESAADRRDEQEISRYFRLWPGIGAEDEGLTAYSDFVVRLVSSRARKETGARSSPLYYLAQLTSLLEAIAHIVDQHQPVIAKYYGRGRMGRVVGKLVSENDRAVKRLVEGWEEERGVGRLIADTEASNFPLLSNPGLLPPLFPSLANTPGQLSLANLANTTSNISNAIQSYAPRVKGGVTPAATPIPEEDTGPDPRDVDRILGELVALGGRWALFRRFILARLREDAEPEGGAAGASPDGARAKPADGDGKSPAAGGAVDGTESGDDGVNGASDAGPAKPQPEVDDSILTSSISQRAMENLLRTYYQPLEEWYLRTAIEKAHKLDTPDAAGKPYLSSILDDTFYLVKIVLTRALSCGSLDTLARMRARVVSVLERDYMDVLSRKLEAVYAPGDRSREKDQRTAAIIYLNDLDLSSEYVDRLVSEWRINPQAQVWDVSELDRVQDELELFGNLALKLRLKCKAGLDALFANVLRPRLRSLLDETYKDVRYVLSEDEFAEAEERDIVRRRFVRLWTNLTEDYKAYLSDNNFHALFATLLEALVRPWEKLAMGLNYTDFGAVRFERDIKNIANFLNNQTSFGLNVVREKMVRLNQIALVLNFDEDELADIDNVGVPWRLSKAEIGQVLELRV